MTLFEKYEFYKHESIIEKVTYKDDGFAGNPDGTCGGQCLIWLSKLAGKIKTGEGLKEPLLSFSDKSSRAQYVDLDGGKNLELARKSEQTIEIRQPKNADALKSATPWAGKYKIYEIASSKGNGHFLGAYFPWRGNPQLFDPNLVHCEVANGDFYKALFSWPNMYDNLDGGLWGFEYLYVVRESSLPEH